MSDILARICADKRAEVARRKRARPLARLIEAARAAEPARGFAAALREAVRQGRFALIAEIKKASPSHGLIRAEFDPGTLARAYREGGATCLSVVTDGPYFNGDDAHLTAARSATGLPCLRKDFLLEPYQIVETRAVGADCVILIMAALDDGVAAELEAAALEWNMDVLVEVHDEAELERAWKLKTRLIGINNRNLKTLAIELSTTLRLVRLVPEGSEVVSESGLSVHADLRRLAAHGVHRFLVGEALLSQDDVATATAALLGESRSERATA